MKRHKLEIACFNYESALVAQQGGADRIELCDSFSDGGTTPAIEIVKLTRKKISIDLFIMIRPRGGNFVYSDQEFERMKKNISEFKQIGIDGFVFGILN
ncbi:MAG: copper homeostasis protein CutC, partial [Bacteroidia bacterium]